MSLFLMGLWEIWGYWWQQFRVRTPRLKQRHPKRTAGESREEKPGVGWEEKEKGVKAIKEEGGGETQKTRIRKV